MFFARRNYVCSAVVCLAVFSSLASAQSTISGQARDASGAVIVGATVEAASPALIEGARTATTNGEGRYSIVDVHPGTYTVTFTMQGFSTVRQQVEVPANVTVPVDGEMKVGSVGETVNVEAAVATVDVDNAAHPQVMSGTTIDEIPNARNLQSVGSYVPGVHLNLPDVGGTQQTEQTFIFGHGNQPQHTTYLLDGIFMNTTHSDGQYISYVDNAFIEETTYQTSNVTADVQGGGVMSSVISRDGGNDFHGQLFLGYIGSQFVGSNIDANLIARGVTGQSKVNRLEDFDGAIGGRIIKDKLWFLAAMRDQTSYIQAAGVSYPNGAPGIEKSYIYTPSFRLTYQINSRNKFAVSWFRSFKWKETDVVTSAGGYNDVDPAVSSHFRKPVMYYILMGKWTGTITPKLLLTAGYLVDKLDFDATYQPGVQQVPFSPAWYQDATELDTVLLNRYVAGSASNYSKYDRYVYNASGTYITGPHQIRFGISGSNGIAYSQNVANGDAAYNYANGVPVNITAYNTPNADRQRLNGDPGVYLMDTYRYKRLSVTAGVRWEYLSLQVDPEVNPAGRFSPARSFPKVNCSTVKGLTCFKDWAPRLGMIYDVFGDHKTAVKFGIGKYNAANTGSFLNAFDAGINSSESVAWVNAPTTACQAFTPANPSTGAGIGSVGCVPSGTGFNSGNIGPNPNPNFGTIPNITLDPHFHRDYTWQYNVGVQRELTRSLTLNAAWNHQAVYQQALILNSAVSASAWTQFTAVNPLDGSPLPIFNLQPAYFGLAPVLHETNAPQSLATNTYNGFEVSVTGKLWHGIFVAGGWTLDRTVDKACDENTSATGTAINDPNSLRYCDWSGGLFQNLGAFGGVPYRNEFKLVTSVPLKWGIQASMSIYADPVYSSSYATTTGSALGAFDGAVSGFKTVDWTVTKATKYPLNCNCPNPGGLVDPTMAQSSETLVLIAPGSRLTPRLNQVDVGLRKSFTVREKYKLLGEVQFFNLFNSNVPTTEGYTLGSNAAIYMNGGIGGVPQVVMNPRMMRLNFQAHF